MKTSKFAFEINWPLVGSIHSCVSSLKHIHFAIINHFLFNCNVSKMAAHSERKTQTANFRAVQNFAKSNWQETAQLHTFAHSVTSTSLFFFSWVRLRGPSKWEADIWGWLEVRRCAMLHFNERQRPYWACRQYGHTGGTRVWLGVERWQLCLRDTSRSAKCHRQAAVGHWISLYVKCCRMVDSLPIWYTISIL
jgi:hypothetical protein